MVRATMMTSEQIEELVALAQTDAALWEQLKDRELEIEKALADAAKADAAKQGLQVDDRRAVLDPPKLPTMAMMLTDLTKRRYGQDENLDHGSFIMAVRRRVREELGLPV
jgi:hypothetical protein